MIRTLTVKSASDPLHSISMLRLGLWRALRGYCGQSATTSRLARAGV
jgi:hypothetical protein